MVAGTEANATGNPDAQRPPRIAALASHSKMECFVQLLIKFTLLTFQLLLSIYN